MFVRFVCKNIVKIFELLCNVIGDIEDVCN